MAERINGSIYTNGNGHIGSTLEIGRQQPKIAFIEPPINPTDPWESSGEKDTLTEFPFQYPYQTVTPSSPPLSETHSLDQGVTAIEAVPTEKIRRKTWVNEVHDSFQTAKENNNLPEYLREYLLSDANYFKRMSVYRNYLKEINNENKTAEKKASVQINYWGGTIYRRQESGSENQEPLEEVSAAQSHEQRQDYQNYVSGLMRLTAVLGFINESELPHEERGKIYELYKLGKLPYYIAMDTEDNDYQTTPEEFLKRILPYRIKLLPMYQERYGNISNTIATLCWEGRLPLNSTLLPIGEFDELISLGMRNHDIDHFDYMCRANRWMEAMSPKEKAKIFQIISSDPQYNINDLDFVREERVERAFKEVKGTLFQKASLKVGNIFSRRTNRPEINEAEQLTNGKRSEFRPNSREFSSANI